MDGKLHEGNDVCLVHSLVSLHLMSTGLINIASSNFSSFLHTVGAAPACPATFSQLFFCRTQKFGLKHTEDLCGPILFLSLFTAFPPHNRTL